MPCRWWIVVFCIWTGHLLKLEPRLFTWIRHVCTGLVFTGNAPPHHHHHPMRTLTGLLNSAPEWKTNAAAYEGFFVLTVTFQRWLEHLLELLTSYVMEKKFMFESKFTEMEMAGYRNWFDSEFRWVRWRVAGLLTELDRAGRAGRSIIQTGKTGRWRYGWSRQGTDTGDGSDAEERHN